jgi:hypothetical protein
MNNAVELHDSVVAEVTSDGRNLRVVFRPAYVHRSEGLPGCDSGWGYLQPVEYLFQDATYIEIGECKGSVSDGVVTSERVQYPNIVPLPLSIGGAIRAELVFLSGGLLRISAQGFSCTVVGETDPAFKERYER